jgi:hypothetical protein
MPKSPEEPALPHEKEHPGSILTHPYTIYIGLTLLLFGVICLIGWAAWTNGWVPSRGNLQ